MSRSKIVVTMPGLATYAAVEILRRDVIVCAGGLLPTPFLRRLGIEVETKFGTS